ncbi:MAG: hypothetical protein N3A66_07790, partial [Planctomycetota bacterium]|nr:hypothetical protein [Planctomycetota bacterium]
MACWRVRRRYRLLRLISLSAALLSLTRLGIVRGEDVPPLAIAVESLPLFIFADDLAQFTILVRQERERPPAGEVKSGRRAFVTLICGSRQNRQEVEVPPYRDRSAICRWTIDLPSLPQGGEIIFTAAWADEPSAAAVEERAAIFHVDHACPPLQVRGDHLCDPQGRRAILAIPRREETAQRRWLPLRLLAALPARQRGEALLVGGAYGGSDQYAEIFSDLWRKSRSKSCRILVAKASEWPILGLVLSALSAGEGADAIMLFPGNDDVRLAVPLEEYYLGLHAAAAALESRGQPMVLAMAVPPPSAAWPGRAERYQQAVRRVAEERGWRCVALPAPVSSAAALVCRERDAEEHRQAAVALIAAIAPFSAKEIILLSPLALM